MVSKTSQKHMVYIERIVMALTKGNPSSQNYIRSQKELVNTGVRVL